MWTYMFRPHFLNSMSIDHLEAKTGRIQGELLDKHSSDQAVRMEVCRLLLVVEALKEILVRKGVMTEEEFMQLIVSLDMEDGVRDGMRTLPKNKRLVCNQCGQNNQNRPYCMRCGHPLLVAEMVPREEKSCPKCRKPNAPALQECLYCGTTLPAPTSGVEFIDPPAAPPPSRTPRRKP